MGFSEELKKRIEEVSERPGVYLLKDRKGRVIYIGKAKNLKHRLKQYLNLDVDNPRMQALLRNVKDFEYFVTESEAEALLLEANLIKRYQPRYNVRLKDDKKYPYIKITISEKYPRVYPTRDLRDDGSLIFGPYTSAKSLRQTLRWIRKLFPIRTCKYKLPSKRKITPCIDYYMGKCLGPCFRDDVEEEYRQAVQGVINFLSGKTQEIEEELENRMKEASRNLNFEKAAVYRDQLMALRKMMGDKGQIYLGIPANRDYVAIAVQEGMAMALVLEVRGGKVVGKQNFFLDVPDKADRMEILENFLTLYYSTSALSADRVIVKELPPNIHVLEELLKKRGKSVEFKTPGPIDLRLYNLAEENARKMLEEELKWKKGKPLIPEPLKELQKIFQLKNVPVRILCFDISQLFGKAAVGASVEFRMAKPYKKGYRRFKIKKVKGIDDYAMMKEIVERRLRHELEESSEDLPQMILIDGGIGQLRAAIEALETLGLEEEIKAIAIAKRLDELVLPDGKVIMLPPRSSALRLLQHLRDEAHRFAITYHRKKREKEAFESFLDSLPGIGEQRKRLLINYFGSLKRLYSASPRDIAKVKGIGEKLAQKIYLYLHGE